MKLNAIALLSSALALQSTAAVQLLPAGEFAGRISGRPGKGKKWKLSDPQGKALAERLNARHATVRFNFDYEHQFFLAASNGQPAPASGWATKFEWRDGAGLFTVDTQWTDRAKQMIEAGEYAYLSPAIEFDKDGQVIDVINASLTNVPDLDISPVGLARLSALFPNDQEDEPHMDIKAILAALGLGEAATQEQALSAIATLSAAAQDRTALLKSLGVPETTAIATATTAVATLRAKADAAPQGGEPDPTKYVGIDKFNQLATEVATLRATQTGSEVEGLIQQAIKDGKCAGVVADVWRDVGKKDIAQLRALIDKTPANPALAGQRQTDNTKVNQGGEELDASEIAVCRATGIDPKDYLATRKAQAAAV